MNEGRHGTSTLRSKLDDQTLFFRYWRDDSPTVSVYIVHGLSEHSERYNEFAIHLSKSLRANVFAIDHRAHGYTACPTGAEDLSQLGVFNTSKDKKKLNCLEVMGGDVLQLIEESSNNLPIIIFGHSMGSAITRWCIRLSPPTVLERIRGVVLSGIPTVPAVWERFPLLVLVSAALAMGKGQDALHNFIIGKFDTAVRHDTKNKTLPKGCFISSVLEEVEKFNKDPLCGQTVDLHIWKSLRSTMIELETPGRFFESLGERRMPILFVSGRKDPVCNYGRTSEKCAKEMKDLGFPVTEIYLDDCIHEFLHEAPVVKAKGTEETTNWIKSKL
jgi:alpha-beta hydrolase superfamily lysophospholipase